MPIDVAAVAREAVTAVLADFGETATLLRAGREDAPANYVTVRLYIEQRRNEQASQNAAKEVYDLLVRSICEGLQAYTPQQGDRIRRAGDDAATWYVFNGGSISERPGRHGGWRFERHARDKRVGTRMRGGN